MPELVGRSLGSLASNDVQNIDELSRVEGGLCGRVFGDLGCFLPDPRFKGFSSKTESCHHMCLSVLCACGRETLRFSGSTIPLGQSPSARQVFSSTASTSRHADSAPRAPLLCGLASAEIGQTTLCVLKRWSVFSDETKTRVAEYCRIDLSSKMWS